MKKHASIDIYSKTATPLQIYFHDTYLSVGSGFYWKHGDDYYLVTNWHNVTGINPLTGRHMSETAAEPNKIIFDGYMNADVNQRTTLTIGLYTTEGTPVWLEHPVFGRGVDVVCIRLNLSGNLSVFPINQLDQHPIALRVGCEVFILGYPLAIGPHRLPIWKRASTATEPDIDIDNKPLFFVDSATAPGMSGSPVIRRSEGGVLEDGSFVLGVGIMNRFVGIYSGRILPDGAMGAQLGLVWKARVIDEIIAGGVYGNVH